MKNLTEIKNKISNYDYMSYQEYKNLKEEIFSLDDDSISKLYGTTMDSIDEKETELYFLEAEAERDMKTAGSNDLNIITKGKSFLMIRILLTYFKNWKC